MAVDQYNMMSGTDYIGYARESIANYYMEYEGVTSKEDAYALIEQNNDLSGFVKDPSGKRALTGKMKSTARLLPKIIRFHLMAVIKIHVFMRDLVITKVKVLY